MVREAGEAHKKAELASEPSGPNNVPDTTHPSHQLPTDPTTPKGGGDQYLPATVVRDAK